MGGSYRTGGLVVDVGEVVGEVGGGVVGAVVDGVSDFSRGSRVDAQASE
jgi:hypothetical protein